MVPALSPRGLMRPSMEFSRCVIDSSVFVAFYRDIDALHVDALRVMQALAHTTLVVHPYVIQETATVLAYGSGMDKKKSFLSDIAIATNIEIPIVDVRHDMWLFENHTTKMSFTDISLIGLAKETNARLVTFDKQMLSLIK